MSDLIESVHLAIMDGNRLSGREQAVLAIREVLAALRDARAAREQAALACNVPIDENELAEAVDLLLRAFAREHGLETPRCRLT